MTGAGHESPSRGDEPSPDGVSIAGPTEIFGAGDKWLIIFVLIEISCQLLLALAGGERPIRIAVRIVAIGAGLAFIFLVPRGGRRLSVIPWFSAVIIVLIFNLFHPDTEGITSGLAQAALYVSVMSPLLWVPRLRITSKTLDRTLEIFWAFHFASTVVGVLQVLYPGTFETAISSSVRDSSDIGLGALMITLDNGVRVLRPMGLSDTPGAASVSGMYAIIFGAAFLSRSPRVWKQILFACSILAGVACIALSQVRALAVVVAIAVATLTILLLRARQIRKLTIIGATLTFALFAGAGLALSVATQQVEARFASFLEERPEDLYQTNRGVFLEATITDFIPTYPFGAGLGRWGMMNYYFGDEKSKEESLYAEIQVTAWVFDGGIPLLIAYGGLLIATFVSVGKILLQSRDEELTTWAMFICSYDVGLVALVFSYPLFVGQLGLEFWLFNASLMACAAQASRRFASPASMARQFATGHGTR